MSPKSLCPEYKDASPFSVDSIIVQQAPPGVNMTSLLFARGTDCVLVGDSDGQVTFYGIKNLNVDEGKQVKVRRSIVHVDKWLWVSYTFSTV